jgi:hypothetical protein
MDVGWWGVLIAVVGRRHSNRHAFSLRLAGRMPDREERPHQFGPRRDAGHGRDDGLCRLAAQRISMDGSLVRRAGRYGSRRDAWLAVQPCPASTTSPWASPS